ncbi:hypothetical protein M422DRAFT_255443 [Sphaerobolus stellatus SS14]|uniref:Major facilitator superfamily (MFS) profile domain-containing protein n=1 Tax=Sphaerobolus stellatus (strain SS14) TaxID=990650 RepID=A0A0C9V3P5_SPHS4|nr:hypothetical protein M422DRAFT_255443 [Sphaerobolus stellatus SS14]
MAELGRSLSKAVNYRAAASCLIVRTARLRMKETASSAPSAAVNSNSSVAEAQPTPSRGHSLESLRNLPPFRKFIVLGILCSALFLDTFNNSSLFAAIPPIALQLNIPDSQSVWLLGAYQLTFAALLLIVSSQFGFRL